MMARLKNNTSKTNRTFFIFSPIIYDFKNVLVLMLLIEIKTVAFRCQCCCAIINAETAKPLIQAYKVLEDITSITTCQEKKLCLSYAICSYKVEWDDSHTFFNRYFITGNSHKCLQNFFQNDNFTR